MTFRIEDLMVSVLPERFDVQLGGDCGDCTTCSNCSDTTGSVSACSDDNTGACAPPSTGGGNGSADGCEDSPSSELEAMLRLQLDDALAASAR